MHTPWIWKISRNDCLRFLDSHGCTGLYRSSFGFGARRRGSPSERGLYANSSSHAVVDPHESTPYPACVGLCACC